MCWYDPAGKFWFYAAACSLMGCLGRCLAAGGWLPGPLAGLGCAAHLLAWCACGCCGCRSVVRVAALDRRGGLAECPLGWHYMLLSRGGLLPYGAACCAWLCLLCYGGGAAWRGADVSGCMC